MIYNSCFSVLLPNNFIRYLSSFTKSNSLANLLNIKIKLTNECGKGSEFSIIINSINIEKINTQNINDNLKQNLEIINLQKLNSSNHQILNHSECISDFTDVMNDYSKMKIDFNKKKIKNILSKNSSFKEDIEMQRRKKEEDEKNIKFFSSNNCNYNELQSRNYLTDRSSTVSFNNFDSSDSKIINFKCKSDKYNLKFNFENNNKILNIPNLKDNQYLVKKEFRNHKRKKKIESNNCNMLKLINPSMTDVNFNNRIFNPKKKILLIDDHKFIRNNIKNMLSKYIHLKNLSHEFEIIEGSDGVDILYEVISDQSINNLIKCIFTDENMEFLNGSEAIEIIKKFEKKNKIKKIPIACITAFEDEYSFDLIYNSGADFVITKPCKELDLINFLERFKILLT